MEYRQLGNSGLLVSVIGLGTNHFGSPKVPYKEVERILLGAIDQGVNLIDTADYYQKGLSEEYIGRALQGHRRDVILASKFFYEVGEGPNDRGLSRYHLMNSLEQSLSRLGTDQIDLYYIHHWDAHTPIEETLRALDDMVRAGKVKTIGCSSFASWQLAHANLLAEIKGWSPFVVIQSHYHLFERKVEQDVLPYCRQYGVGFIPYFPLAGGFLTGKYRRGAPAPPGSRGETNIYVRQYMNDRFFDKLEKLDIWARQRDHQLTEVSLAWLLAQPGVCAVIPGASTLEQFQSSIVSAEWELSKLETEEISQILTGIPEINHNLGKRLGINPGTRGALINHPEDYPDLLGELQGDIVLKKNLSGSFNFIQLFVKTEIELNSLLPVTCQVLQRGGLLWITYPIHILAHEPTLDDLKIQEMLIRQEFAVTRHIAIDDIWMAIGFIRK
jgi:aryl-alcohol dehydrogenase-like predicted oxidoreductase